MVLGSFMPSFECIMQENHYTQSTYDDFLVFKVFILNTANYFGALLYICFAKEYTYGCVNGCCMYDASVQFVAILAVTVALRLVGPFSVYFKVREKKFKNEIRRSTALSTADSLLWY